MGHKSRQGLTTIHLPLLRVMKKIPTLSLLERQKIFGCYTIINTKNRTLYEYCFIFIARMADFRFYYLFNIVSVISGRCCVCTRTYMYFLPSWFLGSMHMEPCPNLQMPSSPLLPLDVSKNCWTNGKQQK